MLPSEHWDVGEGGVKGASIPPPTHPSSSSAGPPMCRQAGGVKHGDWWAGHWAEAEQSIQRDRAPALPTRSAPRLSQGPRTLPGSGLYPSSLLLHPSSSASWSPAHSLVATTIHGHWQMVHLQVLLLLACAPLPSPPTPYHPGFLWNQGLHTGEDLHPEPPAIHHSPCPEQSAWPAHRQIFFPINTHTVL